MTDEQTIDPEQLVDPAITFDVRSWDDSVVRVDIRVGDTIREESKGVRVTARRNGNRIETFYPWHRVYRIVRTAADTF